MTFAFLQRNFVADIVRAVGRGYFNTDERFESGPDDESGVGYVREFVGRMNQDFESVELAVSNAIVVNVSVQ